MEEVQITVVDELYVEQSSEGHVDKQIARVRLFFLGFLSGRYYEYIYEMFFFPRTSYVIIIFFLFFPLFESNVAQIFDLF